jgi:hypothetical protein
MRPAMEVIVRFNYLRENYFICFGNKKGANKWKFMEVLITGIYTNPVLVQ